MDLSVCHVLLERVTTTRLVIRQIAPLLLVGLEPSARREFVPYLSLHPSEAISGRILFNKLSSEVEGGMDEALHGLWFLSDNGTVSVKVVLEEVLLIFRSEGIPQLLRAA